MKKYLFYIFVLISFFVLGRLFIDSLIETKKQGYIYAEKNVIDIGFKSIVNSHKEQSDLIFQNIINKPEILEIIKNANEANDEEKKIIREKLYKKLLPLYENLKEKHFKQLHFHLKDNTSFLRFHRPQIYGDNLSKDRASVVYVNQNKVPAYGFEEGKIYNGYRFIYPLIYNGVHLGSVETSVSIKAFISEFLKSTDADIKFMIRKDLVDEKVFENQKSNYVQCNILDKFMHEKGVDFKEETPSEQLILKELNKSNLENKLLEGKLVTNVNEINETYYVSVFYPIKNFMKDKAVAYLVYFDEHKEIKDYMNTMNLLYIFFVIVISTICYYVFKLRIVHENLVAKEKQVEILNKELKTKYKNQKSMIIHQSRLAQMGEMFSMIVHQIKQPLNSFSLNSDILSFLYEYEPDNKADIEKTKKTIKNVIIHTNETIDNFRNFYKTEKDKNQFKLCDLVSESLFVLGHKIKFNDVKVNAQKVEDIVLNTYNNQLKQVIVAITSNAIDEISKQENREINIKCSQHDNLVSIEISDNGSGIPKEIQETIFDAYFSTKEDENGTGLGLYMSKMIVEDSLNGKLSFTTSNLGTTFKIQLPIS